MQACLKDLLGRHNWLSDEVFLHSSASQLNLLKRQYNNLDLALARETD